MQHRSSLTRLLALALALSLPLPSVASAAGAARNTPGAKTGMVRMPGLSQLVKTGSMPAGFNVQVTPMPGAPKDLKAIEIAKAMTADAKPAANEAVQKAAFEGAKPKAQDAVVDASGASGAAPSGLNAAPAGEKAETRVPPGLATPTQVRNAMQRAYNQLHPREKVFSLRRMVQAAALALVAAIIPSCGGGGGSSGGGIVNPTYLYYASNGHPIATWSYDSLNTADENELVQRINDYRVSIGLSPLIQSLFMGDNARAHAKHMDIHDFYSTVNPEGDGPGTRADLNGIYWFRYGESNQVGWWLVTAYDAFNDVLLFDWAMVEDPYWTHIAVGRHWNPSNPNENFWTLDFKEE